MDYGWYLLTLLAIYGTVAASLVVVVGDLGLLTVSHAAVFGTGAYLAALAQLRGHLPFEASLVIGACGGALLMLMLALIASQLSGDRFVLATLALQIGFTGLAQNLTSVTGGAQGLLAVPGTSLLGHRLDPGREVALFALGLLAFSLVVIGALRRGAYANALHCVRDAELFARSIGLRPVLYRALPMAVVGGVTAAAGGMFAGVLMFVDPSSFRLADSCLLLAMVALGAGRSLRLALVGTILVVGIPETLRFVGVSGPVVGNVRQIIGATTLALAALVFFHLEAGKRQRFGL